MQLSQLIELAQAGAVESLELISLEGGFYLLEICEVGGVRHRLHDEAERVWHVRSVEHARDLLSEMPEVPFYLLHASAHEEMCGLPATAGEPLRVPLSMRSAW